MIETLPVPKVELHCHIEGAAPPSLVTRLAGQQGVDISGLLDEKGKYAWTDFTSFLKAYDLASSVFKTPADYALLAETYFRMLAAEGAIYGEIFISPDHAQAAGLSYRSYVDGLAAGMERAKMDTAIEGRMIAIGVRHFGSAAVEKVAKEVIGNPHPLVTGFGLAGDERSGHPANFSKAFRMAAEAGLGTTAHAGEFGGPDSVVAALEFLRVSRLGHGVKAIEDPDLVKRLIDEDIVLEVCPGSNISLGVYTHLRFHPVNILRKEGVKITLNSDDPPFFGTTLGKEYASVAETFGLSHEDQLEVTRTAIEAAFCDEATKNRLLVRLDSARQNAGS
ncbi:adenosine deaminase [Roseibium denhamense]|uniref:Adenine deaminase n=1 Tax=Roseibium denhamense TaxID=76305 RepID=A0ABY1P1T5_9HYPH|nr:adenosine deaminase [Roseibium denhamense]MTI05101.1 adenosine deaminase [Roseibium denhamense]SMP22868.1 adenosine deaminase [Roseibium denhamense]